MFSNHFGIEGTFMFFFLRFKTASQLLQLFSRMLQYNFNMKLPKCCVQSQNLTEGEQIMTKFSCSVRAIREVCERGAVKSSKCDSDRRPTKCHE